MSPAEMARAVLEFYASHGGEKAWTQGSSARNAEGHVYFTWDGRSAWKPTRWCVFGALVATCPNADNHRFYNHKTWGGNAVQFNDAEGRTFADIEAALRQIAGEP